METDGDAMNACSDIILARADQARALLMQARDAKNAKRISDMAHAVEIYAKRQHASQDCIDYAHGVKVDAMTLLGEFLEKHPKNNGGRPSEKPIPKKNRFSPETLKEIGIDPKESAISQKLARLSRENPVQHAAIREAKMPIQSVFSSAHVSHNSGDNEWYTPKEFIDSARKVMGDIDLDPASTKEANTVVKAKKFYTKEDNGLDKIWAGKVWMNPPYASDLIGEFISVLITAYITRNVSEAIALVNNSTETVWFQELAKASNAICFPKSRIKFWSPSKFTASPLQGQAIFHLGSSSIAFLDEFQKFGFVARVIRPTT